MMATKTYSLKTFYKRSFKSIFKEMLASLIIARELIWYLFLRDFKSRYKQSLLGWTWIFLMPVMSMGTFLLLNISGVIKIGEIPVPYPVFGLLGFSIWQIFSHGLPLLTISVTSVSSLISQINFPREALVISSLGQLLVDFLIRLGLVLITYLIYGLSPSIWILLFPLYLLPLFLFTLGLGFLAAVLNVVIRDVKNFINVGMGFILFLMPIMYAMPQEGFLFLINKYNPLFFLINTPREIIISGSTNYLPEFFLSTLLAVLIFVFGWLVFFLVQPKIAERI